MCGIAGVFLPNKDNESALSHNITKIKKILVSQHSRGPDTQQLECIESANHYLLLGHNRLSIVDLHQNSNQPMWSETKRFCIAYNGMLYNYPELREKLIRRNYTFYSEGDTEVILNAFIEWGIAACNLFNGMFAIVLYDKLEEKLYLIRDRFGIKPLFYAQFEDKLYFASTSAELASQLQLQPNLAILAQGLHYWCYDSQTITVYHGLSMVAPSEVITVDYKNGWQITSQKYYSLSDQVAEKISLLRQESTNSLIEKIEYYLTDAIKIRLRADVPIGISLSGGVDSATIASLAKKELIQLNAFSFGSPEDVLSEASLTKKTAEKLGIALHFVSPSAQEKRSIFWQTLKLQDAPFPNFSIAAQNAVFNYASQLGIKVMLGGQGGDEIFMGYRKYFLFYLQKLVHEKKYFPALFFLSKLLPTMITEVNKLKTYFYHRHRYGNNNINDRWQNFVPKISLTANPNQPLWQRQYQDIYNFSLPTLLRYEDRNSMGNSIESRLPFLDYRLVELALALPETLKLHKGYNKWVLRKLCQPYIPQEISFSRVKRGFDVDSKGWVTSGIGDSLRGTLKSNSSMLKQFGLADQVDNLFTDQRLSSQPFVLAECITLAWLAEKQYFIWR